MEMVLKMRTMVSHKLVEADVDVECTVDLEEICAVVASVGSEVVNVVASVVTEVSGEVSEAVIVAASAVEVTVIGKGEMVAVEDVVVVEVSVFPSTLGHFFTIYLTAPNEPRSAAPA